MALTNLFFTPKTYDGHLRIKEPVSSTMNKKGAIVHCIYSHVQ